MTKARLSRHHRPSCTSSGAVVFSPGSLPRRPPADRTARRLRLYVGLYGARGRFEASLSDSSAAPFWDGTLESAFGNAYRVYTIHYAAASPGQSLAIRWTASTLFDEHYGNVT